MGHIRSVSTTTAVNGVYVDSAIAEMVEEGEEGEEKGYRPIGGPGFWISPPNGPLNITLMFEKTDDSMPAWPVDPIPEKKVGTVKRLR